MCYILAGFIHFAGKTRIAPNFSKYQFSDAYLSVTIEQFHFPFGASLLNHIYPPFHQLTVHHDVQIQANQRLWFCIYLARGVLLTIIWAAKRIDSPRLGSPTAYSYLPFCHDISVYINSWYIYSISALPPHSAIKLVSLSPSACQLDNWSLWI